MTTISPKKPFSITVKKGQAIQLCMCGKSNRDFLCDNSHLTTTFKPQTHVITKDQELYACDCPNAPSNQICTCR